MRVTGRTARSAAGGARTTRTERCTRATGATENGMARALHVSQMEPSTLVVGKATSATVTASRNLPTVLSMRAITAKTGGRVTVR